MTEKDLSLYFPTLEPELISEIFSVAEVKTLAEGELLMRTGQNIRATMLVIDGLIKIYREDDQGNEVFMYYLDGGQACAISLVCALGQETSGLMAKADKPSTVLSIPVQYTNEWMGKYKSWAQFAVNSYRQRFDELLQTIDHIAFRNMDERLVFYLKRHQEKLGTNFIAIPFTEMAQELNSSREVISRLMKKLSEKGIVKLHGSKVEIINLDVALS
ncbi:Crp/Fnr family transcriptional regulator [Paracnuella aquatica]|uniref:Crp/Fnr family transcriptional regulator n=1 Tax=Paracnuella aquatica TaxID=2268757 RepID=UPI000DEFDA6E|nr:Crp/Fnr family transcriptional regulator [Paracnuella aquatica]RPD49206.1 Crp/Fnr family transcriptional regulator [Paracnuella aquatica]